MSVRAGPETSVDLRVHNSSRYASRTLAVERGYASSAWPLRPLVGGTVMVRTTRRK